MFYGVVKFCSSMGVLIFQLSRSSSMSSVSQEVQQILLQVTVFAALLVSTRFLSVSH